MVNYKIISKFGPGQKLFFINESKIIEGTCDGFSGGSIGEGVYGSGPQLLMKIGANKKEASHVWVDEFNLFKSRRALAIHLNKK